MNLNIIRRAKDETLGLRRGDEDTHSVPCTLCSKLPKVSMLILGTSLFFLKRIRSSETSTSYIEIRHKPNLNLCEQSSSRRARPMDLFYVYANIHFKWYPYRVLTIRKYGYSPTELIFNSKSNIIGSCICNEQYLDRYGVTSLVTIVNKVAQWYGLPANNTENIRLPLDKTL